MKKAIVCILALALVLAASLALADQKITLMLGNSQADSHPWNRAIEDLFIMLGAVIVVYFIVVLLPDLVLWLPRLLVPKYV